MITTPDEIEEFEEIEELGLVLEAYIHEEYVLGYPMHLGINLRCVNQAMSFYQLPFADLFSIPSELGMELRNNQGNAVVNIEPIINPHRFEHLLTHNKMLPKGGSIDS